MTIDINFSDSSLNTVHKLIYFMKLLPNIFNPYSDRIDFTIKDLSKKEHEILLHYLDSDESEDVEDIKSALDALYNPDPKTSLDNMEKELGAS